MIQKVARRIYRDVEACNSCSSYLAACMILQTWLRLLHSPHLSSFSSPFPVLFWTRARHKSSLEGWSHIFVQLLAKLDMLDSFWKVVVGVVGMEDSLIRSHITDVVCLRSMHSSYNYIQRHSIDTLICHTSHCYRRTGDASQSQPSKKAKVERQF